MINFCRLAIKLIVYACQSSIELGKTFCMPHCQSNSWFFVDNVAICREKMFIQSDVVYILFNALITSQFNCKSKRQLKIAKK